MCSLRIRCLRALFAAFALLSLVTATSIAHAAGTVETAIRKVMDASVVAWANGDLPAFMETYEDSPDTIFVTGQGIVRGKPAIAARYAAQFGTGGPGKLGQLSFDVLEIRAIGSDHALMVGRYHLRPSDPAKPEASGIFSLLFHERAEQWRIVCDHTS